MIRIHSHNLTTKLFSFLAFALIPAIGLGQFNKASKLSFDALREGNRIKSIQIIRDFTEKQPQFKSILYQLLPNISDYSITNPLEKLKPSKAKNQNQMEKLKKNLSKIKRHPAIAKIVEQAKDRRVVILNEAHDMPQHRAFGMQLALELRKHGFDFLAMETLTRPDQKSGIVSATYPQMDSGHYTADPVFGDFVRQAIAVNYQLVAYEIEPGQRKVKDFSDQYASILERENAQSNNLIKHVLGKHKSSKVFVYVGYSHATEDWNEIKGKQIGWFAAQIKKKTGIDPLTIDQVGGSYNPNSFRIDPVFNLILKQQEIETPIVSTIDNQPIQSDSYFGKVDWTVFHPPHRLIDGRPNWLHLNGFRKPAKIKNKDFYQGQPTLIQAFLVDEKEKAIPVDQVMMNSDEGSSTFLLPKGIYRIQTSTASENKTTARTIEIN